MSGIWRGARSSVVLLVLAAMTSPAEERAATVVAGELGKALDAHVTRLEAEGFSGALLVERDGAAVVRKAYGWADRRAGIRATTETVFNLGSIAKQFTAAAILKLEVMGELETLDPVTRFFEGVPPDKRGMTLHHLLTHSSGLASDFATSDYEPVGREEYVRRALASDLLWPPGTRYAYSNAGYSLLAAVVEIVSGVSYESYLQEHILKPANLFETGYKAPAWPSERIAHGYRGGEDWGTVIERLSPPGAPFWNLRGNGGVHTTLRDVSGWHRALGTDVPLPAAAREKLFTPYIDEDDSGATRYAYGWVVERTPRGSLDIWHNGGNQVYMAELHRFVGEGVLIFVASTSAELDASTVFEAVRGAVFGEP